MRRDARTPTLYESISIPVCGLNNIKFRAFRAAEGRYVRPDTCV